MYYVKWQNGTDKFQMQLAHAQEMIVTGLNQIISHHVKWGLNPPN